MTLAGSMDAVPVLVSRSLKRLRELNKRINEDGKNESVVNDGKKRNAVGVGKRDAGRSADVGNN